LQSDGEGKAARSVPQPVNGLLPVLTATNQALTPGGLTFSERDHLASGWQREHKGRCLRWAVKRREESPQSAVQSDNKRSQAGHLAISTEAALSKTTNNSSSSGQIHGRHNKQYDCRRVSSQLLPVSHHSQHSTTRCSSASGRQKVLKGTSIRSSSPEGGSRPINTRPALDASL
jgi:hypothetical protein